MKSGPLPFVFVNMAMTADGKIAPASRKFEPFAGPRDHEHLLELRATADAVMSGARTVDSSKVNLGPGPARFRRLRFKRGLSEYNLRIIVTGRGTINPEAEIFKHRFSPIIILSSKLPPGGKSRYLFDLSDEVKIFSQQEIDFEKAFRWLRKKWNVKRLLCEGGGELNAALFRASLVDELHLTIAPVIFGGRTSPTIADGPGIQHLADAASLKLVSMKRIKSDLFLVYRRK